MIRITDRIAIPESELSFTYTTSQGPGGQNVNKVATAARLVFDAADSPSLPPDVKIRLRGLAGRRMTAAGILTINAQRFRSQERNRDDSIDRLVDLLQRAAERPTIRIKKGPTRGMIEHRLDGKRRRSATKQSRGRPSHDD
jgi:ribosome-associated protein